MQADSAVCRKRPRSMWGAACDCVLPVLPVLAVQLMPLSAVVPLLPRITD